jgi:alpha/beta superfamily hydrolase
MDFRYPVLIRSGDIHLHAVYHIPVDSSSPYPLVVMCHGLGGDKVGRHRFFVRLSEELAARGVASLRFDFEGCGDSEGDFLSMTIDRWTQNLVDVLRWIDANPIFHGSPIGIFGRSFGGVLAVRAASLLDTCYAIALQSSPFDSARYTSPVTSVPSDHIRLDGSRQTVVFLGEELSFAFSHELQQLNMTDDMGRISTIPFFYVLCKNDIIVDSYHAKKFQEIRSKTSTATSFLELPSSDHGCSDVADRKLALCALVNWFSQYLC